MRIDKIGIYEMSEENYFADPCPEPSLSSSIGKILLEQTPHHAWHKHKRLNPNWESSDSTTFDRGKAAHSMILGEARDFVIVQADDWRTAAAKSQRADAYAAGKTPILAHQMEGVGKMVAAFRLQLAAHQDARDAFTNGVPDRVLVWKEGDVWCRARLDWTPNRLTDPYDDLKSTGVSANPDTFSRQLFTMGYDFQAAFYRRGIRAVLGVANPEFRFVVVENEAPYALSVIGLPPAALDMADRKVDEAIKSWNWCLSNNKWPGYPGKTVYAEMPAWMESQWLEREARAEAYAKDHGTHALRELAMVWQSPLDMKDKPNG